MRFRYRTLLAAVAAAALAGGCSSVGVTRAEPTWVDKPDLPPADAQPNLPGPRGGGPPPEPGAPPRPGQGGGGQPGGADDPNVLATKLTLPWGIALLPDGAAIVGERTTGRIVRVEPEPHRPVRTLMTIGGIDASGDGGLLGLALSPTYREDRLVFAYVTTPTDNRILRFELGGTPKAILTGIPRGRTGNGGRLAFGPDGLLYVGTGDTGTPSAAADRTSLAGKVLRVTPFGRPAEDNPFGASPVYATGFHDVTGLCFDSRERLYATDVGNGREDEVNLVQAGHDYGWPTTVGRSGLANLTDALQTLKAAETGPGGCGVMGFGLFVSALTGARVWAVPLSTAGKPAGSPKAILEGTYGRLRSVEPAPDGALWLTTSNKDGKGRPTPDDDRVIRIIVPPETSNPVT